MHQLLSTYIMKRNLAGSVRFAYFVILNKKNIFLTLYMYQSPLKFGDGRDILYFLIDNNFQLWFLSKMSEFFSQSGKWRYPISSTIPLSHVIPFLNLGNPDPRLTCRLTYLKLRPGHRHVYSVCVGPPAEILVVIGITNSMIELIVDLGKPKKEKKCKTRIYFFNILLQKTTKNIWNKFWIDVWEHCPPPQKKT